MVAYTVLPRFSPSIAESQSGSHCRVRPPKARCSPKLGLVAVARTVYPGLSRPSDKFIRAWIGVGQSCLVPSLAVLKPLGDEATHQWAYPHSIVHPGL